MRKAFAMLALLLGLVMISAPVFADTGPPVHETSLVQTMDNLTQAPQATYLIEESAFFCSLEGNTGVLHTQLDLSNEAFNDSQKPCVAVRQEGIPRLDLHPPNAETGINFVNKSSYFYSITECEHAPWLANYLFTIGRWV